MGEYVGLFLFLGFFIMAFWILFFLLGFLGYWVTLSALYSLKPSLFTKKADEIANELEA